jgi:hypothetical protein
MMFEGAEVMVVPTPGMAGAAAAEPAQNADVD